MSRTMPASRSRLVPRALHRRTSADRNQRPAPAPAPSLEHPRPQLLELSLSDHPGIQQVLQRQLCVGL